MKVSNLLFWLQIIKPFYSFSLKKAFKLMKKVFPSFHLPLPRSCNLKRQKEMLINEVNKQTNINNISRAVAGLVEKLREKFLSRSFFITVVSSPYGFFKMKFSHAHLWLIYLMISQPLSHYSHGPHLTALIILNTQWTSTWHAIQFIHSIFQRTF